MNTLQNYSFSTFNNHVNTQLKIRITKSKNKRELQNAMKALLKAQYNPHKLLPMANDL